MKLTPLGIHGAYPPVGGGTSAYLVESGETRVMLDFGSGALSRIQGILPPEKLDAIVLTHLHSDHMCDMLNLRYYLQLNKCPKLTVFLPKSEEKLYTLIAECEHFHLREISERTVIIGELSLSFYEMKHPVATFGVRVESRGRVLAYSADTKLNDNLPRLISGAHLFLADSAVLKRDETAASPHMAVYDAAKLAVAANVPMLLTHFMKANAGECVEEAVRAGAKAAAAVEGETYAV